MFFVCSMFLIFSFSLVFLSRAEDSSHVFFLTRKTRNARNVFTRTIFVLPSRCPVSV